MMNLKKAILFILLATSVMGYSQKKKVAVVTFYANKVIDFTALDIGSEELIKDVLDLREDPNFNLTPLLEKFHTNFFEDYAKEFPFELLPEATVLESEKYKNFQPKYELSNYDAKNYLVYDGYKYVYEGFNGKYNEEGLAKLFADEADGVLFVYINFGFEKGFGIGNNMTLKMMAFARMALYNKTGEKVFVINESERSKKTGVMIKGIPVMKPEKILPMCDSALTELMGDLKKRIAKITAKSAKKL